MLVFAFTVLLALHIYQQRDSASALQGGRE
jgi:hypothetical protein